MCPTFAWITRVGRPRCPFRPAAAVAGGPHQLDPHPKSTRCPPRSPVSPMFQSRHWSTPPSRSTTRGKRRGPFPCQKRGFDRAEREARQKRTIDVDAACEAFGQRAKRRVDVKPQMFTARKGESALGLGRTLRVVFAARTEDEGGPFRDVPPSIAVRLGPAAKAVQSDHDRPMRRVGGRLCDDRIRKPRHVNGQ